VKGFGSWKKVKAGEKVSGSVYDSRPMRGKSEEVRMRQLMSNEYGKRATPEPPMDGPVPGFARRTQRIVR
jgi:hypothetical protein